MALITSVSTASHQALFKGIFVRYLRYFIDGAPDGALPAAKLKLWRSFLTTNADSVWLSQDAEGKFPLWWGAGGPTVFPTGSVNLQTAAIDAFVAAASPAGGGGGGGGSVTSAVSSNAVECSGSGTKVRGRCVCRTRFIGAQCQQEISWLKYYSEWAVRKRESNHSTHALPRNTQLLLDGTTLMLHGAGTRENRGHHDRHLTLPLLLPDGHRLKFSARSESHQRR